MKKDLKKGLEMIDEGLKIVYTVLSEDGDVEEKQPATKSGKKTDKAKSAPAEKVKKDGKVTTAKKEKESDELTHESIDEMGYMELKAQCAKYELGGKGSVDELRDKLHEYLDGDSDVDEDDDDSTEDKESLTDYVTEMLEGYEDSEIADLLSSAGITPKGKRTALISKVVEAVEQGTISFDDEDATDDSVDEAESADDEDDAPMTEEREKATDKKVKSITAKHKKGNITDKDVKAFLEEYFSYLDSRERKALLKQSSDELFDLYVQVQCSLIDDDGEEHELEDGYYINDELYCCGQAVEEVDDELTCPVCGSVYSEE